jgi:hypothetical protein
LRYFALLSNEAAPKKKPGDGKNTKRMVITGRKRKSPFERKRGSDGRP